MVFYSQDRQDEFLEKFVFKGYKNGVFMDVGAHNGLQINNTLFFEKEHNWTGVNVEPIESVYNDLVTNRPTCINICCAISESDGTADFLINYGYTEMLSGLKSYYDKRHFERLKKENIETNSKTETITVNTKRIETICDEYNINRINYLSIDVEGAEFSVIKSINFEKVFIDLICFESNYPDTTVDIVTFLEGKNYVKINYKAIDTFMIHRDSPFLINLK